MRRGRYFLRRRMAVIRTVHLVAVLGVVLCVSAGVGFAQSIEGVRKAYEDGRFLEAVDLAEALGTAEALTFANLSLITHGYYIAEEDEKREFFERAMAFGEEAARLDPEDPEHLLYWSHAMGRYMKAVGVMKAARRGYGGEVRKLVEAALALDPDLALAHTTLGAWHVEGIKKGGFLARTIYGASKKIGREHFERAIELAPDSKMVLYECARGLLILNERKHRDRARDMFARALAIPALNAAERFLDQRIAKKLERLEG